MIYCDTSFLFSLYVEDVGSSVASKQVENLTEPLIWTSWHQLEFTSALEARVGRKANTRKEANSVMDAISIHLEKDGFLAKRSTNWEQALARSSELSQKWGATFGCRSLDVLHVGICLDLEIELFWSLDARQRKLAKAAGLKVNKGPSI